VYGNSHPIRYFKLVITDAGANNDHCTQLTRFALFAADGEDQALGLSMKGVGTDATTLMPGEFYRAMDYRNYDGNADTLFKDNYDKWCFANQNGGPGNADAGDGTYTLVMRLKDDAKEVVSYNFRSGGDDEKYHDRSLRGWILYGSENGTDWFVLDEREGFPNVAKNNAWYNGGAAFPCRYFSRTNDRDYTIPAGSVVEVARGARLGVYTAMTISALRVALDGEGASPVVDGLNMASSGALYLTSDDSVSLLQLRNLSLEVLNLTSLLILPVSIQRINDALSVVLTGTDDVALVLLSLEGSSREALGNCSSEVALTIAQFCSVLAILEKQVCTEIGNLALSRAATVVKGLNDTAVTKVSSIDNLLSREVNCSTNLTDSSLNVAAALLKSVEVYIEVLC
jgi:hypothetical protein